VAQVNHAYTGAYAAAFHVIENSLQ